MAEIGISDVCRLIALASRVSLPPRAGELTLSSTEERKEIRFARVLDSLANLSVSAPQHEVIAVTFLPTNSSLELLIAGNEQVQITTTEHIKSLWALLKKLLVDYKLHNPLLADSKSPPQPKFSLLPSAARKRVKRFQRTALKFCGEKLNRRIVKHLHSLRAVDSSQSPPDSNFPTIQKLVQGLADFMKARSTFSDSDWDELWDVLDALHVLNGKICWEDPDDIYGTIVKVFPLQRYLDKVVAVSRDIKIMLNAANSPQLRQYFIKDFTITTVNPIGPFPFPLPKSEDGWQAVVQIALQELNTARTEQGEEEFEAVATKIKADAQRLANRTMSATNYVHCECILLSYMLAHRSEQFISYIGVSKLCCQGCFHLINTANNIYGTRIVTKGCHHKWYYPWRMPRFPVAKEFALVNDFYAKIAWIIGHTYPGFRSKTQRVLSNSEAPDLSEDDEEPYELDPKDVALKFITKTSLEAESRLSGAVTH